MSEPSAIAELKRVCLELDVDFDKQLLRTRKTIEELTKVSNRLKDEDEDHDGKH